MINKCAAEIHLADDKNVVALMDREQFSLKEVQKRDNREIKVVQIIKQNARERGSTTGMLLRL